MLEDFPLNYALLIGKAHIISNKRLTNSAISAYSSILKIRPK